MKITAETETQGQGDINKTIEYLIDKKRFSDANWLITKHMTKKQNINYAIFAAKQVLHLFEEKYPDDIEAAESYNAANAAAANAAAYSAACAAYAVANAAAYAADAADAADDTTHAAYAAMYERIIQNGLEIINKEARIQEKKDKNETKNRIDAD